MRFIGHLDLLKLLRRALARAGAPVAYSAGFNPHQLLSVALPLPLGMAGLGECADVTLTEAADPDALSVMMVRLNSALPAGVRILRARALAEGDKRAAAAVCAAVYDIALPLDITAAANGLLNEKEILLIKKTKSGIKEIDIRPDILAFSAVPEGGGTRLSATLRAGGDRNVKPDLLLAHIAALAAQPLAPYDAQIGRTQLLQMTEQGLADLYSAVPF